MQHEVPQLVCRVEDAPLGSLARVQEDEWHAVKDAIDVVLRRLSALPPSPEVEELRARAEDWLQQAQGWQHVKPTAPPEESLGPCRA